MFLDGMKLIDIAKELGVPEGTVRRWKSTQSWGNKSERSEKVKANVRKQKENKISENNEPVLEEVKMVMGNDDLTDKQRLFCLHYVKCFNATKAYQKAYGSTYEVANSEGYKLLVNPCIKNEINRLKQNRLNREMLDANDIFQKYMDIAFADITDYADFGTESFTYTDKQGEEQEAQASYVRLKSSNMVDGTIISEVKMGKDGASVKLNDRMKALQWLTDHMDLATEEQRAKIAVLKTKIGNDEDNDPVVIVGEGEIEE